MNVEHTGNAKQQVPNPTIPSKPNLAARITPLICLILVIAVIGVIAFQFAWLSLFEAAVLCILLVFGFIFFQKQTRMAHELGYLRQEVASLSDYRGEVQQKLDDMVHQVQRELKTSDDELQLQLAKVRADFSAAQLNSDDSLTTDSEAKTDVDLETEVENVETSETGMPVATFEPFKKSAIATNNNIDLIKSDLKDVLSNNSLNMHLQPIVDFQSRQPVFFDAFMRLSKSKDTFLEQKQFIQLAEQGGLMPSIDKKILFSSIRMLDKLSVQKKRAGVVCPISILTLQSRSDFEEIAVHLSSNSHFAESLLIEIRQRDFLLLKKTARQRLSTIASMGFKLSMSHTMDLSINPKRLADFGFLFIKVPASILIHADIDQNTSALNPSTMSSVLGEVGMRLVATEVERESDALALIDFNVPLGQGKLFAPPRPVKSDLLKAEKATTKIESGAA